jgi:hypothetical protein
MRSSPKRICGFITPSRRDLAVREIREVPGDRRRADVERDAERAVVEPGPDSRDDARSWTATVTR